MPKIPSELKTYFAGLVEYEKVSTPEYAWVFDVERIKNYDDFASAQFGVMNVVAWPSNENLKSMYHTFAK